MQPQRGTDTDTETENTTAYSIHKQMTVKIHNKTETRSGHTLSSEEIPKKTQTAVDHFRGGQ